MSGPDESNLVGQCWSCSNELSGRFCRNCGADNACTVCGAVAPKSFCGSCGTNLSELRSPQDEPQSIPILPPLVVASEVGEASEDSQDSCASDDTEQLEEPEVDQAQEIDEPVDDALGQAAGAESDIVGEGAAVIGSPRFNPKRKLVAGVLAFSLVPLAIGISLVIASADSGGKQAEVSQSELIEEPVSTTTSMVETTSTTIDLSFLNSPPAPAVQPERSSAPQATTARAEWNAKIQEGDRIWRQCISDASLLLSNSWSLANVQLNIDPSDPSRAAADSAAQAASISAAAKYSECDRLQAEGMALMNNPPR